MRAVDARQHLILQGVEIHAQADEEFRRRSLRFLEQGQQDVFRADVIMAKALRLLDGPFHDALGPRRIVGIVRRIIRLAGHHCLDLLHDGVEVQSDC